MLLSSFYLIFWLAAKQLWVTKVFPPVDCTSIETIYGEQLETYALADYEYVNNNKNVRSSGCLQCYCYE